MNLRSYEELITLQKVIIHLKSNSKVIRTLVNALPIWSQLELLYFKLSLLSYFMIFHLVTGEV